MKSDDEVDFGFKKVKTNEKVKLVRNIFSSVAKNYDLFNDIASFGLHRAWKKYAIWLANIQPNDKVLDIASGTGDLALELSKKLEQDSVKRNSLVSSGDRSAKIRTYNYPQGRVTDHRIGLTLYDLQNIINGDIQKLIDEIKLYQNTQKLKEAGEII